MNPLAIAKDRLLVQQGLLDADVQAALSHLRRCRVDAAELYFQALKQESWALEDGLVSSGSFKLDQGVGARVVSGERTAYAYSQELSPTALVEAARTVRSITASNGVGRARVGGTNEAPCVFPYDCSDPAGKASSDQKIELLQSVDRAARRFDPRVVSVAATLGINFETVLIVCIDGKWVADIRPLVRLKVQVVASAGGRYEMGASDVGGRFGIESLDSAAAGREAVSAALLNLESRPIPGGEMPVVLGSGWPGILIHESVGHGLEGDHVRKGLSLFSGMTRQRVAAPGVTVVDDGCIPNSRGSLAVDDEGNKTRRTVLIEDGRLCGFMQDQRSARAFGTSISANSRRQSYAHPPMPRMTNTFLMPGPTPREEVIASLKRGLFVTRLDSGQVDISSGNFVFTASQAYWVENGRIKHPAKLATLAGNGLKTLSRISLIGNDLAFDSGGGVCTKENQHLPVTVGQPTVRVDCMTVGGAN